MTEEADEPEGTCPICGRDPWSDGLVPVRDGNAWICGDCDAARNLARWISEPDAPDDLVVEFLGRSLPQLILSQTS